MFFKKFQIEKPDKILVFFKVLEKNTCKKKFTFTMMLYDIRKKLYAYFIVHIIEFNVFKKFNYYCWVAVGIVITTGKKYFHIFFSRITAVLIIFTTMNSCNLEFWSDSSIINSSTSILLLFSLVLSYKMTLFPQITAFIL